MNTFRIFNPPLHFDGTPEQCAAENARAQATPVLEWQAGAGWRFGPDTPPFAPGPASCFAVFDYDLTHMPIYRRYPWPLSWLRRLLRRPPEIVGYYNALPELWRALQEEAHP